MRGIFLIKTLVNMMFQYLTLLFVVILLFTTRLFFRRNDEFEHVYRILETFLKAEGELDEDTMQLFSEYI
jgi:uncharacterized membrane protein